jgi:hypothetical protein
MMRSSARAGLTAGLWIAIAIASHAGAAHAELFRCTGPDGKAIFTDQKSRCPGADASEPAGVVHRAPTPDVAPRDVDAPPSSIAAPGASVSDEAADAAGVWKRKKLEAEQRLAQLQARRDRMEPIVSHCNRPGRYVTSRDDAGIQQVANCSELKRQFDMLENQEAAARDYLTTGLPDECRRAGCLPGWVR